ncbi:MAG: hypothetical protein ACI8TQ_002030, partial [Planctomycetota bacterium]
ENLWKRGFGQQKPVGISGQCRSDTGPKAVSPRHERRASRRANRVGPGVAEQESVRRQVVYRGRAGRRSRFRVYAGEVDSHVVAENQDDIRPFDRRATDRELGRPLLISSRCRFLPVLGKNGGRERGKEEGWEEEMLHLRGGRARGAP